MTAVNAIRHIYKTAEWSFDENEFLDERATREHSVLLENDLEVVFHPLLRHLSKLILKINSEYSVASSVTNGRFRFEMYINSAVLDNDQSCFLVQMFLNDCDFLISENRELPQNSGNLFNNIPVAFLMN